jgi:wobble nucleotide-excising tRNase
MIKRIQKLEQIGIFNNFSADTPLPDFKKFNVIYGWNGSGKSTLSKVIGCIGKQKIEDCFPDGKISIKLDDGTILNENNLNSSRLKIKVFNQDFIENNIDWKGSLNPILYISNEKIELKKEYDEISDKHIVLGKELRELEDSILSSEKEENKILQVVAKNIKTVFQAIETSDQKYLNYNKKSVEKALASEDANLFNSTFALTNEEYQKIVKAIKPIQKDLIDYEINYLNKETFLKAYTRIEDILNIKITSKIIAKLAQNPDLNSWVETGLHIHKDINQLDCEFCGNKISEKRIKDLEEHFNKAYEESQKSVNNALNWIRTTKVNYIDLIKERFYDEFQGEAENIIISVKESIDQYNRIIDKWIISLEEKRLNPFVTPKALEEEEVLICHRALQIATDKLSNIINTNNLKTQQFASILDQNKQMAEYHLLSQELGSLEYKSVVTKKETDRARFDSVFSSLHQYRDRLNEIEKELVSEVLAAEDFNESLHKFLGRSEILLEFDESQKGYRIIRSIGNGNFKQAYNLSEGEKTAIAFIYYITSLQEQGQELKDLVVWIDDPISSFDTNHLFNAFVFLVNKCHTCNQLFIATHNFWFFKLVRDWMTKDGRRNQSSFYVLDTFYTSSTRIAAITKANKSIIDFHSEYHYLFSQIVKYYDKPVIDFETSYMLANAGRRVLESLLTFKYPKTKDLRALINKTNFDADKKERIYWFVQKYSHSDRIETHETIPDNLFSEGHNVLRDIIDLIKEIEPEHYNELIQIGN